MLFLECFNKNVYIGDELVGYISKNGTIYINNRKFAVMSDDGKIFIEKY